MEQGPTRKNYVGLGRAIVVIGLLALSLLLVWLLYNARFRADIEAPMESDSLPGAPADTQAEQEEMPPASQEAPEGEVMHQRTQD